HPGEFYADPDDCLLRPSGRHCSDHMPARLLVFRKANWPQPPKRIGACLYRQDHESARHVQNDPADLPASGAQYLSAMAKRQEYQYLMVRFQMASTPSLRRASLQLRKHITNLLADFFDSARRIDHMKAFRMLLRSC